MRCETSPPPRAQRTRAFPVLLLGALSTMALWRARTLPELAIDLEDLSGWVETTDTAQVVFAIVCHLGIAVAGYVTAISALYLVAAVTRVDWLARLARTLALPPLRRLLDVAVASSIVLGTAAGPAGAGPAAVTSTPPATVVVATSASPPPQTSEYVASLGVPASPVTGGASRPAAVTPPAPSAVAEHVVRAKESWWSITADALGSGEEWRRIEAMTVGREVAPGIVYQRGMTLQAGWTVLKPAPKSVAGLYAPEREHVVAPSENFWSISRHRLAELFGRRPRNAEIAPYHRQMIERNRDRLVERDNPDLILPDQVLVEPAVGAAPVETPQVGGAPGQESRPPDDVEALHSGGAAGDALGPGRAGHTEPTTTVPASRNGSGTSDAGDNHSARSWAWRVTGFLAGATALASWVLAEARRRRDRRLRQSRGGQMFPPPDPTVATTAASVHGNSDLVALDRLDAALRHLAGVRSAPTPQVALRHPSGDVEVFLAEPIADAPAPWTARATGRVWALEAGFPLAVDEALPSPCPALVQLGTCEDGAELFTDLEALGTLGIDGPPEATRQVARAVVATLVVSPGARLCRILTQGFDPFGLDDEEGRLAVVERLGVLLDEAERTSRVVADAVDVERVVSSFRLRAKVSEEGWEPAVVVVAGGSPAPEEVERLRALGERGGRGVAVVRATSDAPWMLHAVEPAGWWRLDPLGIRVRPVALAEAELRELAAYLAEADTAPLDVGTPPAAVSYTPAPAASGFHERPWLAMVRLLGPTEIVTSDGRTASGDPGRPLELLAWLTTHRSGATRARALRALWADRDVVPRILRNVITGARLLLRNTVGEPPDGAPWIPMGEEDLALHPLVVTDVDLIRDRVAYARRAAPEEAASVLAGGLELLRGMPFEGRRWFWVDEEFLSSRVAIEAVEMVTELATLRLKAGDVRGALEATDAGLRVIPLHDQLIELSMKAWMAVGDRNAALAVYESYERATTARGEEVGAEIASLRNQLLRAATPE